MIILMPLIGAVTYAGYPVCTSLGHVSSTNITIRGNKNDTYYILNKISCVVF